MQGFTQSPFAQAWRAQPREGASQIIHTGTGEVFEFIHLCGGFIRVHLVEALDCLQLNGHSNQRMTETVVQISGEPLAFLKSCQFGVALMCEFQFLLGEFQFGDQFRALAASANNAINEEKDRHAAKPLERKSNHGAKRNLPEVPIRSDQGDQKRDNGCSRHDCLKRQ